MKAAVARAFRLSLVLAPLAVAGCSLIFGAEPGLYVFFDPAVPVPAEASAGWRATVSADGQVVLRYTGVDAYLDTYGPPFPDTPYPDPDTLYLAFQHVPGASPRLEDVRFRLRPYGIERHLPPRYDTRVRLREWDLDGMAEGTYLVRATPNGETPIRPRAFRVDLSAAGTTFD
ncbi:MAG TPA: hypothetical protein VK610_06015 [Rhodothermales bacterium]|nr:hypothetical protein [Rhodothermales bacterium]